MRYSKFNLKQVKKVYLQTKSITKTAKIIGCSPRHISRLLKKLNDSIINQKLKKHSPKGYLINENFFDKINHDSAYVLGYIAGDGNVKKNENRINIPSALKDKSVLEKIKNKMSFTGNLIKEKEMYTLSWWSKYHKEILINKYGMVPNKTSKGWMIPNNIPDNFMFDWIRGFFDSDGSIKVHLGKRSSSIHINFSSKHKKILKELLIFLQSKLRLYNLHRFCYKSNSLEFVDYDALQISSYMYMNVSIMKNLIFHDRKYAEWLKTKNFCELDIKGIYRKKNQRHQCEIIDKFFGPIKSKFNATFTLKNGKKIILRKYKEGHPFTKTSNDADYILIFKYHQITNEIIDIFYIPVKDFKKSIWIGKEKESQYRCEFDRDQINKWVNNFNEKDIGHFSIRKKKKKTEYKKIKKNFTKEVICPICKESFNRIPFLHIKSHGLTTKEFKDKFPDSPLWSDTAKQEHSEKMSGKNHFNYGKKLSRKTIEKKRESMSKKVKIRGICKNCGKSYPKYRLKNELCFFCLIGEK